MKNFSFIALIILLITIIYYLPAILNPALLLGRGNDLQEQFWPIFYFIREQIISFHTIPFWNSLILSGLPLLPDPQFSPFYLPNILFIIFPTSPAFIISFITHSFFGGLGMYLLTKLGFKWSTKASLFTATIYIFCPKIAGFLEAGHFGLVASMAWFPFLILALFKLFQKPKLDTSLLLGISLAGVFYTHAVTFLFAAASSVIFLIINILFFSNKLWFKQIIFFLLGGLITFGLSAVTLLPQMEWIPQTNRFLLVEHPDVYPKWISKQEFLTNIFWPWTTGIKGLWNVETEKWLFLGLTTIALAAIGFWSLPKKIKLLLLTTLLFAVVFASNNLSPFYSLLLSQSWYDLTRVTTRIWFIPLIITILLAGLAIEILNRRKINNLLIIVFTLLTAIELLTISWLKLAKPIDQQNRFVPISVYQFLKQDPDKFRVFCVNRCLSQQKAAQYQLELADGYNTLQQKNYIERAWQFTNSFWDYYTLALPPVGLYKFTVIKPDAKSLGEFNVKYILTTYDLHDSQFVLVKKIDEFRIYSNQLFKPRAYLSDNKEAPLLFYSPNYIKVKIPQATSSHLILAEVYSPGWTAYLNGNKQVPVLETPQSQRAISIDGDTTFVELKYQPGGFKAGLIITIITALAFLGLIFKSLIKKITFLKKR